MAKSNVFSFFPQSILTHEYNILHTLGYSIRNIDYMLKLINCMKKHCERRLLDGQCLNASCNPKISQKRCSKMRTNAIQHMNKLSISAV